MTPTPRNPSSPVDHGNTSSPNRPPNLDSSSTTSDDESLSIHPVTSNRDDGAASLHVSLGPDDPVEHYSSFVEVPDAVYERFPRHRKTIMVVLLSFCSFLSPISSTSVLAATPEVAAEYRTTGTIINLANAMYMLTMGISPVFWAPLSEVYGRRRVSCCCDGPSEGHRLISVGFYLPRHRSTRSRPCCFARAVSERRWRRISPRFLSFVS